LDQLKALSDSLRAERQAKTGEGAQVSFRYTFGSSETLYFVLEDHGGFEETNYCLFHNRVIYALLVYNVRSFQCLI
jgi:hypothetical protein